MESKFKEGFKEDGKIKIFTIPNIMTMFRIALIPVFIWRYEKNEIPAAFAILVLSGVTDVVDGFIARRFNMISAVGKALDPISDKLTQIAVLYCFVSVSMIKAMWIPLVLLIIKELSSGIVAFLAIKSTGEVHGAAWHGKLTTFGLYAMMALHIIWQDITPLVSNISIAICIVLMLNSMVLYCVKNVRITKNAKQAEKEQNKNE